MHEPGANAGGSNKCLGSLVIEEQVSSSASGELFLARQPALDRVVWLRKLPATLRSSPGVAERFLREARLGARTTHPNLVGVYDCFAHEGAYYLVSEHVEGTELSALCIAPPRVPRRVALSIGLEIARGLRALHARRIVHRGLAPDRVLISRSGDVKLADLGDAQDLDVDTPAARVAPGPYCAPELSGNGGSGDGTAGPACDVYSLGSILHDLLTGETPPRGTSALDPRIASLVRACLEELPQRRPSLEEVITRLETRVRSAASEDCRVEIAAWLWERTHAGIPGVGSRREPPPARGHATDASAARPASGLRRASRTGSGFPELGAMTASRLAVPVDGALRRMHAVVTQLGDALGRAAAATGSRWRVPTAIAAGLVVGVSAFWLQRGATVPGGIPVPDVSAAGERGLVTVVAYPWAEVSIESGPSFVTPRAAPVELPAGHHAVHFEHPSFGHAVIEVDVEPGTTTHVRHVFETAPPAQVAANGAP